MDSNKIEHIDDKMSDDNEVIEILGDCLKKFDRLFEEKKISISKRPLSALIELDKLDLIQMHKGGETLPQKVLLSPPWVSYILRKILRWYLGKYGKEACTEI